MQIQGMGNMMSLMGIGATGPPNASQMSKKLIDMKDTDGDGAISIEEFEDKFKFVDVESDGLINQDELFNHINENWQSLVNQPGMMVDYKPDIRKVYEKILSQKDEDKDGALSNSELNISEEMFASIDTNKDGVINSEEFETHITDEINSKIDSMLSGLDKIESDPRLQQMTNRMLVKKDEDEDEQLSSSETDLSEESFSEIDTNRDGYISQAELTAWFTKKTDNQKDLLSLMA